MPKYACYGRVVGSKYLGIVEAKNEEEAKEKAYSLEEAWISLCHQCSGECEDPAINEIEVELEE